MEIRDAVEADAPMLAGINQRLVQDEWGGGSMSLERLEERARRRINDDEYRVLLFRDRGNDVAYALVTADDESAFIHHFYVMPEHRGGGTGRQAAEGVLAAFDEGRPAGLATRGDPAGDGLGQPRTADPTRGS